MKLPDLVATFPRQTLMPIADAHPANEASENVVWSRMDDVALERYRCMVHREHKVGELLSKPFEVDSRGQLHSALSFTYAGSIQRFQTAFKKFVRKPGVLHWRRWGDVGPGQAATRHNESVFYVCGRRYTSKTGMAMPKRVAWFQAFRQFAQHLMDGCADKAS